MYNSVVADRDALYETGLSSMLKPAPTPAKPDRMIGVFTANRQEALLTFERSRKPWLRRVSSVALIQAMRDADQAYKNFFDWHAGKRKGPKVGHPKKKTRLTGRQCARFTSNGFKVDADRVYLAKIGWIRFRQSRPLPSAPSTVTIIRKPDRTWEVSFVCEVEAAYVSSSSHRHAGIDLGLKEFASIVYDDGTRQPIANPRFVRKAHKKLAKAQRRLSRKVGPDKRTGQKPSNGWKKQNAKVNAIYAKTANARKDFARKLANQLARENATIAVESLNLWKLERKGKRNTAKGRRFRRAMYDAAFTGFTTALANAAGPRLVRVDPAYTSQVCAVCGHWDGRKPLHVREWTCPTCGSHLERDYNAAVNILSAAGHAESLNAGGSEIRLRLSRVEAPASRPPAQPGSHWSTEDSDPTAARDRQPRHDEIFS